MQVDRFFARDGKIFPERRQFHRHKENPDITLLFGILDQMFRTAPDPWRKAQVTEARIAAQKIVKRQKQLEAVQVSATDALVEYDLHRLKARWPEGQEIETLAQLRKAVQNVAQ